MTLRLTAAALLMAFAGSLTAATHAEPDNVRVGITAFGMPEEQATVVESLNTILEPLVQKRRLNVKYYSVTEL